MYVEGVTDHFGYRPCEDHRRIKRVVRRLESGHVSVRSKSKEFQTHLLILLSDGPYEEQATIHLHCDCRQGALY